MIRIIVNLQIHLHFSSIQIYEGHNIARGESEGTSLAHKFQKKNEYISAFVVLISDLDQKCYKTSINHGYFARSSLSLTEFSQIDWEHYIFHCMIKYDYLLRVSHLFPAAINLVAR